MDNWWEYECGLSLIHDITKYYPDFVCNCSIYRLQKKTCCTQCLHGTNDHEWLLRICFEPKSAIIWCGLWENQTFILQIAVVLQSILCWITKCFKQTNDIYFISVFRHCNLVISQPSLCAVHRYCHWKWYYQRGRRMMVSSGQVE